MKKMALLIMLFISTASIYSQRVNSAIKYPVASRPDTIIYYKVDSESMSIKGNEVIYKVNNQIVSKEQWNRMTIGNGQMKTCTPCMVKTYDDKETLLSIGMQYKWCKSGIYTEYYPDGKIKVTGQYKASTTDKSVKPGSPAYCGVKDGTWTYYNETGEITQTQVYKNGLQVK